MSNPAYNPCITCGACCAHFRASFHWSESESSMGGAVPTELTEKINEHHVAMKGTNCKTPRCIALQGEIGKYVLCSIYPQRSSTCREFSYAWENNQPHDRCDKARAAHGLPALPFQTIPVIPSVPVVTVTSGSMQQVTPLLLANIGEIDPAILPT